MRAMVFQSRTGLVMGLEMGIKLFHPTVFLLALFLKAALGQGSLATAQDSTSDEAATVDFAKEIQPLLARRCFACHGPDVAEGGLRLNSLEGALAELDSGDFAVVAHNPDASVLLDRIASEEEGVRMPPEGKPLSESEQDALRRWIASGAQWKQHWAFEPIVQQPIPQAEGQHADVNPVDAFIDAKLRSKGLSRTQPASPGAIQRRVYFDLIGLPPSPDEVADFLRRAEVDFNSAYEQEVDKLLGSEHYGERWARHWLDVVRFAETNSFERDGRKPNAWRYRDYVIQSLNEDKPYDQFLREQLAGDELPNVTRESLVATGFYRLGLWDDEPADRELAMYEGYDDIITTVGQGILGITMNCCRCHDHKIDPIPTADYYSMLAFFRNLTPNGYGPHVERPLVATAADREKMQMAEQQIRERGDQLQAKLTQLEADLQSQLSNKTSAATTTYDLDNVEYRFYRDSFQSLPNFDDLKPEDIGKLERPYFDIQPATRPDEFGFVFTGTLVVPSDGQYTFVLDSDDGSRLIIEDQVVVEHDGIHVVGTPKRASVQLSKGRQSIRLEYFQASSDKGLRLFWSGPGFKRRWLTARKEQATSDLNQVLNSPVVEELDADTVAEYRATKKAIDENARRKPWDDYGLCASEHGTSTADTFVLLRGSPESRGEKVEPRFPTILGGASPEIIVNPQANTSGRRLAFANWITSADNRLTSRVIVNRVWQHHFGRGIVRSPNNFGQLGETPTHPELLDWLAANLMQSGWRLKPLHKLLVMSETYRQSTLATDEALEKDPQNDWFSHFNMRRLSAEEIRDTLLSTTGQLNLKMFGPSIFPEISDEVLAGQSVPGSGWDKSSPEERARRSVYIHVKRSLVVPLLSAFDFPETDASCEARFMTTQPGQALSMLNGDFLNQQAALFAERIRQDAGSERADQIKRAFQLALAREAQPSEVERAIDLMNKLRSEYDLSEEQALANCCLYVYNLNEFIYLD
jgi:hypothetical protein